MSNACITHSTTEERLPTCARRSVTYSYDHIISTRFYCSVLLVLVDLYRKIDLFKDVNPCDNRFNFQTKFFQTV